jgi:hypothetical protein
MKPGTALVAILFASASFSLLAQQANPASQPGSSASQPATQQNPPVAAPAPQNNPAASPEASAAPMSPVNGELVSRLDSKTAKSGDDVVVRTKAPVKTADGTQIPEGSRLVGHVMAVQPSGTGTNSEMVLQFDHVELKGGQSLAVHSQIQSIAPPEGMASASGPDAAGTGATSAPPAGGTNSPSPNGATGGNRASGDPATAPAGNGAPAAGTIVGKNGNIAIQTTSISGVLLANNAPGQQDPRMARVSSILLGAKGDIQLDGGTQVVVGISPGGGAQ